MPSLQKKISSASLWQNWESTMEWASFQKNHHAETVSATVVENAVRELKGATPAATLQ